MHATGVKGEGVGWRGARACSPASRPAPSLALTHPPPPSHTRTTQLKEALAALLAQPGAERPEEVRFFRGQMQTIITRALAELELKPLPSRRCFTLMGE